MSVVDDVRANVAPGCLTRRRRKNNCSASMRGIPRRSFLIDMDHAQVPVSQYETRCDFLFVGPVSDSGQEWMASIEMKSGGIRVSEVTRQLQAGADIANRLAPQGQRIPFQPIVVSGRIHKDDRKDLRINSNKIVFRGKRAVIRRIRCGDNLAAAFATQ